jgi:hypothetical protein
MTETITIVTEQVLQKRYHLFLLCNLLVAFKEILKFLVADFISKLQIRQ